MARISRYSQTGPKRTPIDTRNVNVRRDDNHESPPPPPFNSYPSTPKMLATPTGTPEGAPLAPPAPPTPKITRGHSCVLCQQRKVKCDRQKPCANCIKARAECVPSAPTVPRRRRRKFSEQDLAARLRRYEHLLKKHGVKIEDDEDAPEEPPELLVERGLTLGPVKVLNKDRGMLFSDSDHQNSRYVEKCAFLCLLRRIVLTIAVHYGRTSEMKSRTRRKLSKHLRMTRRMRQICIPTQVYSFWVTEVHPKICPLFILRTFRYSACGRRFWSTSTLW